MVGDFWANNVYTFIYMNAHGNDFDQVSLCWHTMETITQMPLMMFVDNERLERNSQLKRLSDDTRRCWRLLVNSLSTVRHAHAVHRLQESAAPVPPRHSPEVEPTYSVMLKCSCLLLLWDDELKIKIKITNSLFVVSSRWRLKAYFYATNKTRRQE